VSTRPSLTLRLLAVLAALAVVPALPQAASASGSGETTGAEPVQVSPGSGAVFPARSLVLTIPGAPAARSITVLENGHSVAGTVATPIRAAGAKDFGIVLAIDVSPSMHGATLENAMQAARELAAKRTGQQQLGIVEFDHEAKATLPLTTNAGAISNVLAQTPTVGWGTHIYDALALALSELQTQQVTAGAVILISDGADRGSARTEAEVAAAARAQHISLYAIGVHDAAFEPASLEMIARDGNGQYLEAASSQLGNVLSEVSSGLTSRYVVHYRSLERLGRTVTVRVVVPGIGSGSLTYLTPPATARAVGHHSFWTGSLAPILIPLGVALLLGLGLAAYIGPRGQRLALRERVASFTVPAEALLPPPGAEARADVPSVVERVLAGARWWPRLKDDMELGRIERRPDQLLTLWVLGTLVAAVGLAVLLGPLLALVALLLGPLALREFVRHRVRGQRELFSEQLPGHLQELASTMRAGHSLVAGITAVAASASEPSHAEWTRIVADEQLGMPLERAMLPVAERMDSTDMQQVALVAALHGRTGGNMAEVIERLADGVRERAELRRELASLTAQARLSRWVVTALPPSVGALLYLINPSYMQPLLHSSGGQLMLVLAAGMVLLGSLVMRRITDIRV
jgi:tight adherence protein B